MPARRSEDPRIDPVLETEEEARAHWDERARRTARPAPWARSLPDRDLTDDPSEGAEGERLGESEATSSDGPCDGTETDVQKATDR